MNNKYIISRNTRATSKYRTRVIFCTSTAIYYSYLFRTGYGLETPVKIITTVSVLYYNKGRIYFTFSVCCCYHFCTLCVPTPPSLSLCLNMLRLIVAVNCRSDNTTEKGECFLHLYIDVTLIVFTLFLS